MKIEKVKALVQQLLDPADVKINGTRPWDIHVHSDNFYRRALKTGTLGLGESYMAGEWDCEQIDVLVSKALGTDLPKHAMKNPYMIAQLALAKFTNQGKISKAFEVGEQHYDIGNELYEHMLDKRMIYTCGYWREAKNLDEAQEAKLDLICRKIGIEKGMRVLDIGGGWGGLAEFVATKYGASVVTVSISKEQVALANERTKGLDVENRLQDYRDLNETFDRIISVGMMEHVGPKNYREYLEVARRCLKEDGLFLLHTIGSSTSTTMADPWIRKYIFPNGVLPSLVQIAKAAEGLFIVEDVHNFGADYDTTLLAWNANFEKSWEKIKHNYSEAFRRMWRLYLLSSAASFRTRGNELYQVVLSPHGVPGGYKSVR